MYIYMYIYVQSLISYSNTTLYQYDSVNQVNYVHHFKDTTSANVFKISLETKKKQGAFQRQKTLCRVSLSLEDVMQVLLV